MIWVSPVWIAGAACHLHLPYWPTGLYVSCQSLPWLTDHPITQSFEIRILPPYHPPLSLGEFFPRYPGFVLQYRQCTQVMGLLFDRHVVLCSKYFLDTFPANYRLGENQANSDLQVVRGATKIAAHLQIGYKTACNFFGFPPCDEIMGFPSLNSERVATWLFPIG